MAYAKEVLHRAEARLDEARRQNELDCDRRISAIYEKLPRLREIDRELRKTSAKVYAAAFRSWSYRLRRERRSRRLFC